MSGGRRSTNGPWGVVCLAALCFALLPLPAPLRAQTVQGSRHDFTGKSIVPAGVCTGCHLPHSSGGPRLWSRDLTDEGATFDQNNDPNYIPKATLLCYDCHDDMTTGANIDPPSTTWTVGSEPQDIAFSATAADVARWKTTIGYYELFDGTLPPGGIGGGPTDGSPTGGHYWKREPGGTADPGERGDKIACSLCHDPHKTRTGGNDVFFLTATTDYDGGTVGLQKYENDHYASPNAREPTVGNTGRTMCAECHRYSDTPPAQTPETIAGLLLPQPPTIIPQHREANATPCTNCHQHNKINASCTECHGYPPLLPTTFNRTTNKYGQSAAYAGSNGVGAHLRHLDALGSAIFACQICHGPNPGSAAWHNETGTGIVSQGNVDIRGLTDYWGAGSSYNGVATGGGGSGSDQYAFAAKGGLDGTDGGRCANLLCHGSPPNTPGALNWTDDMVDDTLPGGPAVTIEICKWCHDNTPAVLNLGAGAITAPSVMGDGVNYGADVNGHGLPTGSNYDGNAVGEAVPSGAPGAGKTCTVCHDARYPVVVIPPNTLPPPQPPVRTHFDQANDSAEKRLQGTINGVPTIANDPNNTCPACHQIAGGGDRANNTQVSTHGNSFAGNVEGAFTRTCRQCHNVHGTSWNGLSGAAPNLGRNLHMVGAWVDANNNGLPLAGEEARVDSDGDGAITAADLPVILTGNSGANSYDDGFNDSQHESVCVVCHVSLVNNHNEVGDNTLLGAGHNPVGTDCMACHDHDYDNNVATADAFAPSGCNGCHGTNATEPLQPGALRGQFWPDGDSPFAQYDYADDQTGAHLNHVTFLAAQVYGETANQLVSDYTAPNPALTSAEKQKAVCAFCHPDPGGAGHSTNDPALPSGNNRVNVFGDSDDTTTQLDVFRKLVVGARASALDLTGANGDQPYNFAAGTCANLVCHNQAATPATWNTPPVWAAVVNSRCSNIECHAPGTYTLAHPKHVGGAAGQKFYECRECHVDNGVNVQHGNGEVDMQGTTAPYLWNNPLTVEGSFGGANGYYDKDKSGAASAGDTAFAYKNGVYDSPCVSIYCHGDDNGAGQLPGADRGTDTTPLWGDPLTAACGDCHGASTASPPGSPSHPKHAGGAAGQYAIGCQACHYGTTTDGLTIASQALHVNTSAEVSFNTLGDARVDTTSSYGGDAVMGSGFGTCAATYCHSRGNDTAVPYNDVPLSVPIAPLPTWGGAALVCSSCHGNPAAATPMDRSMPDYANGTPKANRHPIHYTQNLFVCQICHYPTTQDGATIADTTLHVNLAYNAGPNAAGPALYQFAWANPNCNAVVCHGGNGTITWGAPGPYACSVCHGMVNGAVTNTDVDDFAWGGATPTMSKVSNAEYTADGGGHGDNTAPNQPNQLCSGCHASGTVTHDTSAALSGPNPFRLVDQDGGTAGVQYSCSYATGCHAAGIFGPEAGEELTTLRTHTQAVMSAAGYTPIRTWPGWDPQCTNCHDPHGDGNLSMVNRWVYDKGAFPLPAPAPALPTEQLNLAYTDNTTGIGAGAYAWSTESTPNYSGICQECHEDATVAAFHDNLGGGSVAVGNHPAAGSNPGDCSTCHRHSAGFAPMACEGCHDAPPYQGINGGAGDDAPVVMPFYTVNGHGSKTFDPDGLGPLPSRAVGCSDCHNVASPSPSTHLTGTFESYAFPGSSFGAPNTNTAHLTTSYFGSVVAEQDWQLNFDNQCYRNANCHGNPPSRGHRHEMTHKNGVVRFGDHNTVADPKQVRGLPYWTPWTIDDISTNAPPATKHYAPCVACHDPHGADYTGYGYCPDTPDGNHHMLKKDNCDVDYFCNSNCHRK